MRIAMLSPVVPGMPPRHSGPWATIVSLLSEGLIRRGIHVTLFGNLDSQTRARLRGVCTRGWEEDKNLDPGIRESLHIASLFESAQEFDLIHNHSDFLPLTYSGLTGTPVVTTIHGFPSPRILPVYERYNHRVYYVATSESSKNPRLSYVATVYPGIDLSPFTFRPEPGEYLLFFGDIHHQKGTRECIEIAEKAKMRLIIAGTIQDQTYFDEEVRPFLSEHVVYVGSAGPVERDALLGGAYALLYFTDPDEPFEVSVIEAMACGTPVLGINKGIMSEVVAHGKTGFLVSQAEEMLDFIPKVRGLSRAACRKWVEERFSGERMVEDYIKVYERILDRTKREDHRPWGFYEVLSDEKNHKVKRITVYSGARLSYQRHARRAEHWYIVQGEAQVTLDGKEISLKAGEAVDLPRGTWHRIRNVGPENLVFIEVQTGDYFGEDDIERAEDDYGRA